MVGFRVVGYEGRGCDARRLLQTKDQAYLCPLRLMLESQTQRRVDLRNSKEQSGYYRRLYVWFTDQAFLRWAFLRHLFKV